MHALVTFPSGEIARYPVDREILVHTLEEFGITDHYQARAYAADIAGDLRQGHLVAYEMPLGIYKAIREDLMEKPKKRIPWVSMVTVAAAIGATVCAMQAAWAYEDWAELNRNFASTAGQDVVRQVKHMPARQAKSQLNWLLDAQSKTTSECVAGSPW